MVDYAEELLSGSYTDEEDKPQGRDWAEEMLSGDPVGGTFGPRETPPEGAPTPAPPFPPYPGSHRGFVEPTEEPPGFTTMMDASTVTDPLTKVKIFAESRGIPLSDIAARYRFSKDGEIEFKTDEGTWQRELSEHPLQQAKGMGAAVAAHPSTYMGAAGAMLGPAGAVGGAVAGELTRQTYARVRHDEPQSIGGNLFDIGLEGLLALGGEMTGKLVTSTINRFRTRKAPRILKRAGSEIHGGVLTPADHAKAEYLKALAAKHDITLLPHQLYNKANMADMWTYLRKHPLTANAIQTFDDALENETDEAVKGFIRNMGGYQESPYGVGTKLTDTSKRAIDDAQGAIKETAGPYYAAAKDETPIIDIDRLKSEFEMNKQKIARGGVKRKPDVKAMVEGINQADPGIPTMKIKGEPQDAYASRISKDYKRVTGKDVPIAESGEGASVAQLRQRNAGIAQILESGQVPEGAYVPTKLPAVDVSDAMTKLDELMTEYVSDDPGYKALAKIKKMITEADGSVKKLDKIKRSSMDTVLRKEKADPGLKRELQIVKKAMTDAMDIQVPDYAAARGIYGEFGMRKPLDDLKLSVIGELSQLEKVGQVEKSITKIFGTAKEIPSYEDMVRVRRVIRQYDPDLWDRALAHYIRRAHGTAQAAQSGEVINLAGKMHQRLFGSPNKKEAMAAAFGGKYSNQYKAFEGLMQVFQRAGGGKGGQSGTHFFGEIKENMEAKMGNKFKQFLERPKQYAIDRTFEWWNGMLLHGREEQLLKALADPGIQAKIAQIKPLKPRSRRYIEAFTTLTALVAAKIETQTPPETEPGQAQLPQE